MLVWLDGEQASYAGKPGRLTGEVAEKALEQLLDELAKRQPLRASDVARLDDENLAELAPELGPTTCDVATMKLLLGRLGEAFAEKAVSIVRTSPGEIFEAVMPIASEDLVQSAATLLFESESPSAQGWLLRHADLAVKVLTPLAHGTRDAHGCALAFLVAHGKASPPAWLAPKEAPAARRATLPAFFDLAKLPRPTLKEGGAALSDDEVLALGDLLRESSMLHPHADLAKTRFRCERASLDAFVTALLEAWCDADAVDLRSMWPLEACGTLGGDKSAREVAKRVRAWTRTRGYFHDELAKAGCNVLALQAQHGSELARVLLDEIGRTGGRARKEATKLAGVVDVTSQEEAKVPTLGLDAKGSLAFELGGDTYRVVLDEALVPRLKGSSGARVAAFPRMRKGVDAKAWESAKEIYSGMVKDAKTIVRHELARLERMMCEQEALPLTTFRERYVEHPLLQHLGQRLVWSSGSTFRVTEDGTFADVEDKTFSASADVTLTHAILMTEEERLAWMNRFADYEIVQPIEQLARRTFADAERSPQTIGEVPSGSKTTRGRIFQLVARGWELKYASLERPLPDGATAHISFTGPVGAWSDEYVIDSVICTNALRLPPIAYSELLRDATYLAATA